MATKKTKVEPEKADTPKPKRNRKPKPTLSLKNDVTWKSDNLTLRAYRMPDVLMELATSVAVFIEEVPIGNRTQVWYLRRAVLNQLRRDLAKLETMKPMPDSVPVLIQKAVDAGYVFGGLDESSE